MSDDGDDLENFAIDRSLPAYQQRLAKEKQVNCYFIPGTNAKGERHYAYAVCSALLHEPFMDALRLGVIPDYAVVVGSGSGSPDEDTRKRMREFYGVEFE